MRRSKQAPLADEIVRFQDQVRRLATAAAREIFKAELERNLAALRAPTIPGIDRAGPSAKPAGTRGSRRKRRAGAREAPKRAASAKRTDQLSLAFAPGAAAAEPTEPAAPAAPGPGPAAPTEQSQAQALAEPAARPTGKARWTRETITSELANWMLSGTTIDAAFVARHGPPGLVAAARRVFGRFEAALNVAALHISKLYPDGPPDRSS